MPVHEKWGFNIWFKMKLQLLEHDDEAHRCLVYIEVGMLWTCDFSEF